MKRTITAATAAVIGAAGLTTIATPATAVDVYTVKLSQFTTPGAADSSPGLEAAQDAIKAAGGGKLWVDGVYNLTRPIRLDRMGIDRSIIMEGTSPDASGFISKFNGNAVEQTDPTPKNGSTTYLGIYQYHNAWKNLKIVKPAPYWGNIFYFKTGAQVNARYENLKLDNQGIVGSIFVIGPNHQAHGNLWTSVRAFITKANTYSMFKVGTFHNGWNNNRVESSTFYARDSIGAPCIELRPISGQYTNNSFQSVTFQNCLGGAFHAYGQNGGSLRDSGAWDGMAYYRDVVRIGKTAKSYPTVGYVVSGLGDVVLPWSPAYLMAGRHRFAVGAGATVTSTGVNGRVNTGLTY